MGYIARLYEWCRREWPSILVIAFSAAIQLVLVTRPFPFSIQNLLPDDAFFYFTVARNLVNGLGSTFDGINATNGYHPLWLVIVALITKITGSNMVGDIIPIQAALFLSVAMNVAAAVIVSRVLGRFTKSRWITAFGLVVWVLNPFFIYETLNGLETSLALLLFSIFVLLAIRIEEGRPIIGGYFLVGLVGSLMILARLDMVFYVIAFILWVLLHFGWREGWKRAAAVCVGCLPFLGWIIWNVSQFHMFLTSAANIEMLLEHQLIIQDHGTSTAQFLKAIVYSTQYIMNLFFHKTGMFALGCGLIGAAVALYAQGAIVLPRRLRDLSVVLALFGGFAALFIADAMIRWTYRTWYFVSFELFLAILAVVVVGVIFPQLRYKRSMTVLLLALTLFSFYVNWSKALQPSKSDMKTQIELLQTAQWMNEHLSPGTLVGTFSPGIQGFFSEVPVIDLDGWINDSAAAAMQERQLWKYVKDQNIEYLWDYGPALSYRYKSFLGIDDPFERMTLIEDLTNDPHGFRLYKIK